MGIRNNKANSNKRTGGGFSSIELIITATILSIVTGVGVMGITRARASVNLSGAAREYASYIEKARLHSIRSHADDENERARITISDDRTSYTVTLDLDGDGTMETRTVTLPDGVTFSTAETIAFDWRGRTWNTVGVSTESNAQVSIRLVGTYDSVSIDVTGSGDITVNSEVFDDEVPNVNLHVGDLASSSTSSTGTTSPTTPTTEPTPLATPDNTANPNPTPTPGGGDTLPAPTPTPSATATPVPTPTATPTASPTATPRPSPAATPVSTPMPTSCALSISLPQLVLTKDGTGVIKVGHDAGVNLTITGISSKSSDVQVSPGALTVASGGVGSFTIKSKKTIGTYSVTFSTVCGTKTVSVLVISLL